MTLASRAPMVLVVHPSVAARNVKELIALAKDKPRRFNYATSSQGSLNHLAIELFKEAAGIELMPVAYKGTGAAMTELLAGQIQMTLAGIPPVQEYISIGRLRALAVSSDTRTPLLPEVPSFVELGYRDVEAYTWTGLLLPRATPARIAMRLHDETVKVLQESVIRERFLGLGVDPVGNTPAEFSAFLKTETARWARAVKQAGMKVN